MNQGPPREAWQMYRRFLFGGFVVVALVAAATASTALLEVQSFVDELKRRPAVETGDELTRARAGDARTFLILGSDRRASTTREDSRSDTIMLVRVDPDARAITVLSVPRDLKVDIPGYGSDKINAAYSYGRAKLTLKTVKRLLGIDINHVVNVNFSGFTDIVDSLNCVYVDVDRRYLNTNQAYATIDVQPGYQKLCGDEALDYTRFREQDSDLVRAARQQDFLRQAKEQVSTSALFTKRRKLMRIFGSYAETDKELRSRREVISILNLALFSARKPVAQIPFPAIIDPDPKNTYLSYDPVELDKAVEAFMAGRAKVTDKGKPRKRRAKRGSGAGGGAALQDATAQGENQAIVLAPQLPYPVYFPTLLPPGAQYAEEPRVYPIRRKREDKASYRMVLKKPGIGQYFGVQGTAWKNPPILREASEELTLGGERYRVYYDGNRIRRIAWKTREAAYWISNSLTNGISNKEMLGMVRSLKTVGAPR